MINSQGTFSKHASIVSLNGVSGVIGPEFGVSSEVKVNVEISGVGGTNVVLVQGRIQNSSTWTTLSTITGAVSAIVDTSSVDFIRFNNSVVNGTGTIVSSGFITDKSAAGGGGGAGDASAANQVIGNASLSSIDGKVSTAAKQDTGNSSLSSIDGKFTTLNAKDFATSAKQDTGNSSLSSIDGKTPALVSGNVPSLVRVIKKDGTIVIPNATENESLAVGNFIQKFRDGFVVGQPDLAVWDQTWVNQGSSFVSGGGNSSGSSYMKISMCPITSGSEYFLTSKSSFRFPVRFAYGLTLSQRILGQEVELSLVGVDGSSVVETIPTFADLPILGTITVATNVATINFASAHGLNGGDRVILSGNVDSRLNVGPVVVTVVTTTQITVPLTLANASYTAGGVVEWADPMGMAKNSVSMNHDTVTVTNSTFNARRNGAKFRTSVATILTTVATQTNANPFTDALNPAGETEIIANMEEVFFSNRAIDTIAAATGARYTNGIPDEEKEYKIRIRVKNLDNLTVAIAKIVSIAKTGTTTATVVTDIAHGLTTSDWVQIYGVRDQTNFPNLTAQTVVASIISPTSFTIVIGTASTTSSVGGGVWKVQGSVLAPGVIGQVAASISRTSNVLTIVGNTTWAGLIPGDTIHLYGCDATSLGLYDGAYKVLQMTTTFLRVESIGADFTTINCGGAVIKRTDARLHFIRLADYTRHAVEIANARGVIDNARAVSVTGPVTITSGTVTTVSTVSTVTTVGSVTSANLAIPGTIADVASAALTTTTTTATLTPTFGVSYQVNIPVTVVSGTSPTLDVSIEESDDTGTNWYKVYDFPRITATGIYRSPHLPFFGNRVRYVQTVGGATPSFTRAINRLQSNYPALPQRQLIDRTISLTTLNSTTPIILARDCGNATQLIVSVGAITTTAPAIQLEGSDDFGTTWYSIGSPLTAVANSTVQATVIDINAAALRARVSTAGVGVTANYVMIKAHD